MNVRQCSFCKKPFQSYGSKACLTCLTEMDEAFKKVRDFLDVRPNSDAETVSQATDVPVKMILHLLKEGRLRLDEDKSGNAILVCESCKRPIRTGRLCEPCRGSLSKTMQDKIGKAPLASPKKITDIKGVAKLEK